MIDINKKRDRSMARRYHELQRYHLSGMKIVKLVLVIRQKLRKVKQL